MEWISVRDRLPKIDILCEVCIMENGIVKESWKLYSQAISCYIDPDYITHWRFYNGGE